MEWNTMQHVWLILACFVVAFAPRFIPLLFFRTRKIPTWFNEWMKYVPISLFTALVVKDIFINEAYAFSLADKAPQMIAAVLVIGIAYWTRSMALSVILGLVAVFLLAAFI
ncbi:AzlD domain-containing protein [Lentilactobacillus senioris]|uniref:Branched-chain amino acid transport n=1 Tax=Lentilactobacillus senioris DSM 24302 = JCM 17472 TaxID=1423802 RepID=A0A0R2CRW2_9LACO|nr:AzlD domain-containing protein [Lentilactobacillus senioris]KRM94543.1 branched-chain amino acid transport [Lentilactobacillus senioris DSM 24302 = JCM 17472]